MYCLFWAACQVRRLIKRNSAPMGRQVSPGGDPERAGDQGRIDSRANGLLLCERVADLQPVPANHGPGPFACSPMLCYLHPRGPTTRVHIPSLLSKPCARLTAWAECCASHEEVGSCGGRGGWRCRSAAHERNPGRRFGGTRFVLAVAVALAARDAAVFAAGPAVARPAESGASAAAVQATGTQRGPDPTSRRDRGESGHVRNRAVECSQPATGSAAGWCTTRRTPAQGDVGRAGDRAGLYGAQVRERGGAGWARGSPRSASS